jgi:transcriptional regulator with XRE-family HTH domain
MVWRTKSRYRALNDPRRHESERVLPKERRQDIENVHTKESPMDDASGLVDSPPPWQAAGRLGERLRTLRSKRGLTIVQLAAQARVSSGLISQIERGNSNPSIKTLQRLRAALGVNLWEFLSDQDSGPTPAGSAVMSDYVRRSADRPRIVVGTTRLIKDLLSPRNDRNLRFMLITLPPSSESEDVIMGQGEKGGLVTKGRVRLTIDAEETDLDEGDSFQFPSSVPHSLSNPYDDPAEVLWIMSVVDSHI